MYPEIMRLYSLGFIDTVFLGMRPYTRTSVAHMLDASAGRIYNSDSDEAKEIYSALSRELAPDLEIPIDAHRGHSEIESMYTRVLGIAGQPLRDPYHAGQTIVNDYGRPYAEGFNNITGASVRTTLGRYSGYLRGENQHAPALEGYSAGVADYFSLLDEVPFISDNPTMSYGKTLQGVDTFRIQEAYLAANFASHEISIGKSDEWFGPGRGGGMGYSNNAVDIYSIRLNRAWEPLHIPPRLALSRARPLRLSLRQRAGAHHPQLGLHAFGGLQLQADSQLRVRLRAHHRLRGQGPRAGHLAHLSQRLLRHQ